VCALYSAPNVSPVKLAGGPPGEPAVESGLVAEEKKAPLADAESFVSTDEETDLTDADSVISDNTAAEIARRENI